MTTLDETAISSVYRSIDTSKTSPHFSRFPAAISIANDEVEQKLREVGEKATEPGTRVRRRMQIRHTCPNGDPFGICHASAFPERLILLGSIVEIMWVHDGTYGLSKYDFVRGLRLTDSNHRYYRGSGSEDSNRTA
jgi:hypothetical protein